MRLAFPYSVIVVVLGFGVDALGQGVNADSQFSLTSEPSEARPLTLSTVATGDWRIELTLWGWLASLDGEVGAKGQSSHVSAGFCEIVDASDSILGFSGRLEVGKGPFTIFVDGLYSDLGADDQSGAGGIGSVDVNFKQYLVDFGLMFRIGDWEPTGNAANNLRNTTLDLYAGGRYSQLEIGLNPANFATQSGDEEWLDPIVGAKLVLPLSPNLHVMTNGDVGGFGIESDLTWSATGVLGYDFALFDWEATLYAGYRAVAWDFSEGEFVWDMVMHGPIFGIGLRL